MMIAGNLIAYKGFLETKALAVNGVNKFLYGDATKVAEYSRSNPKFGYPLVHLARPVVVPNNNHFGQQTTIFYSEISAITKYELTGAAAGHDDVILEAESLTLNILLELERQLRLSHRRDDIEVEFTSEIEPILNKWIDKHTGWKMSVKITLGANSTACN